MQYESNGHEVLSVEEAKTAKQTAIVRKHHTFIRHIHASGPAQVGIGQVSTIVFEWRDWQGNALDDQEPFAVEVAGQTVDVPVGEILEFFADEPGEHGIRTVNAQVQNAELVVTVSG